MKTIFTIILCAVLATALAAKNKEIESEIFQKLKQASETCNTNPATYVATENLKKWYDGGEKPANLGPHCFCVTKIIGWQYKDGSVNVEKLRQGTIAVFGDATKFEQAPECIQAQATPEATAENLIYCYNTHI